MENELFTLIQRINLDIFQAIVIGIIEGFTEFLPISSTGHMIVASKFLNVKESSLTEAYQVIIQFAAIMAVMLIYREKLAVSEIALWKKIMVAFFPLAIVGFIFKDQIKALFSVEVVATMFIIGGIIFLIVEKFYQEDESHTTDVEAVSYRQALWVGIAQIFSLVPGTSRAGATIIGGLLTGMDRKTSAEFSFLLAIPVMATVSGYDLLKHYQDFADANWSAFLIGFAVAFVVAYLTIKLFLVFLHRFTFVFFGIYRIILGVILLVIF
jgi:undecaprenyl-diphosphatase